MGVLFEKNLNFSCTCQKYVVYLSNKIKIMYQKCPICNGTGKTLGNYDPTSTGGVYSAQETCTTCNGVKIISEITGLPPSGLPVFNDNPLNVKGCQNKVCFCDGSCRGLKKSNIVYNQNTGDFRDNFEQFNDK